MEKRVISLFMALVMCLSLVPTAVWAQAAEGVDNNVEQAGMYENKDENDAQDGQEPGKGGEDSLDSEEESDAPSVGTVSPQSAGNDAAVQANTANVAEVTIDGTTTGYTDIDAAFAAAQEADSATVKLLADVTISHTDDTYGIQLEKGNITLELNGMTISQQSGIAQNKFYPASAVFYLSVPGGSTAEEVMASLKANVRLTVQDSVGGGKIVQPNGGPAVIAAGNGTLTVNSGVIENTSSDDFDDGRLHRAPNCAVLLSDGGKAVINGGTLSGMRGVVVTGYITKEETELIRKSFGIEYTNELYGNELTVTGGEISGTSGNALIVYEKAKKIELSGGTFTTQSNEHSIWAADSTPEGEDPIKGDAASLLAAGYRYENNGAECAYSENGNGVVGNATVALRPANETAYIGADGKLTAKANCTEITTETNDISQGWYVLKEDVTVSLLNISEEVNVILCDGATLTVSSRLNVGQDSTLKLYWQSGGSGKLTAASIDVMGSVTAPAGEMKQTQIGTSGATFEKCFEHDWEYENNGDTHKATCKLCGKAETAESHKYENWASTDADIHTGMCVCGATKTENHTLSLTPNDDGLTHSMKCSKCGYATAAETHDFSSTDIFGDKKCACGVRLTAEYDGERYATLASAIEAAKDGGTVTLQADVPENITIEDGTNVTIDLNGKKWAVDGNKESASTLTVTGGDVTVQNGTLTSGSSSKAAIAVVVEGGKLTVGEGMTIQGGSDGDNSGGTRYLPAIEVTKNGELTLRIGAKLDGGMKVSAAGKLLKDYLPEGTAFHKVLRDNTESVANGYVQELSGQFVLAVKEHSHSYDAEGKCACGFECTHTGTIGEDGKCTVCEAQMVAKVGDKYYTTLSKAIAGAGGKEITLIAAVDEAVTVDNKTTAVINLGGQKYWTVTSGTPALTIKGNSKVTLRNGAMAQGGDGEEQNAIYVSSGELIVEDSVTEIAAVPNNTARLHYAIGMLGGTLTLQGNTLLTGGLYVDSSVTVKSGQNGEITGLAAGRFTQSKQLASSVRRNGDSNTTPFVLLAAGYAFAKYDKAANTYGDFLTADDLYKTDSTGILYDVTVVKCTHKNGDTSLIEMNGSTGTCKACGYTCSAHEFENGVCKDCGYVCLHEDVTETGPEGHKTAACDTCGQPMAAKVAYKDVNGTDQTKYYARAQYTYNGVDYENTLQVLFNNDTVTPDGSTVTLLVDRLQAWAHVKGGKTIKLDLNGKKLVETGNGICTYNDDPSNKLIVTGTGHSVENASVSFGRTFAVNGGTLEFDSGFGGEFHEVYVSGGTLTFAEGQSAEINVLSIAGDVTVTPLKSGKFGKIVTEGSVTRTASSLLEWGYAFQKADGNYVPYHTEITATSALEDVTVVWCDHGMTEVPEGNQNCNLKCPDCGKPLNAVLTTADGKINGYENLRGTGSALEKAKTTPNCTVTMYCNADGLGIWSTAEGFTLDANDCMIGQLTLSGGTLTVKNATITGDEHGGDYTVMTFYRSDNVAALTLENCLIEELKESTMATLTANGPVTLKNTTVGGTTHVYVFSDKEQGLTVEGNSVLVGDTEVNGNLTFKSGYAGKITVYGAAEISGGSIYELDATDAGSLTTSDGDLTVSGGTFGKITAPDGKKLIDCLKNGYAFYNDGGDNGVVDGRTGTLEGVKVGEHTNHDFKSGKNYACACGKPCEHTHGYTDGSGSCPDCGAPCPHDESKVTETEGVYTCSSCGQTMTVRVAHSDKTNTYYSEKEPENFFENGVKDGDTVILLADGINFDRTTWTSRDATATLNLNGHTLGVSASACITILNNSTLCVVGSGSYTGGFSAKDGEAVLDLSGWTGGTINSIRREWSGSMIPSQHSGTKINMLLLWTDVQYLRELNGGTYGQIKPNISRYNTTAGALLIEGYAFKNAGGSYVAYDTAITEESPLKDVTVVKCDSAEADEHGKCLYCGGTLVAKVKTASGETGYTSLADALAAANAASGSTLTLLADVSETLTVSSPIKLDCNGHTVEKLAVSGNVTLASLLPEGYAFKSDGSWVNDSDLSGKTELTNVTTEIAPVKSVTADNPIIKVKYGEAYTLSTTFEWTGSADSSDRWIEWAYKGDITVGSTHPTLTGYPDNKRTMDFEISEGNHRYPTQVGTRIYVVTFTKDGYSKSCEFTVTIEKANATVTKAPAANVLTYNGSAQALVTAGTAKGGKLVYSLAKDGTYTETIPSGTDADTYTVWYKVMGDENHNNSQPQSIPAKIGQKELSISGATADSKTYDGSDKATITNVEFEGRVGNETLALGTDYEIVSATFPDADADDGLVDVTITVKLKDTELAANYELKNGSYTAVGAAKIGKADSSVAAAPEVKTLTYTGEDQALVTAGVAIGGTMQYSVDGENWQSTVPTGKNAGEYAVHYRVVGDKNHGDTEIACLPVTIARQKVGIPAADATAFTYNGEEQTYTIAESALYTVEGNVQKDADSYEVTVDLKDKANYVWADDTDEAKTYDFTIAQKALTITAKDKTAHVGDKAPDLSHPVLDKDYTVEGLVEGDTLDAVKPMLSGVTLKYVDDEGNEIEPDMSQAGEVTIQVTAPVPEVGNYAPTCVDGKLTISKRSSYYYAPGSDAREQSPGTGDAGMLVYGLTALGGYTGTALVLRRRKRED